MIYRRRVWLSIAVLDVILFVIPLERALRRMRLADGPTKVVAGTASDDGKWLYDETRKTPTRQIDAAPSLRLEFEATLDKIR